MIAGKKGFPGDSASNNCCSVAIKLLCPISLIIDSFHIYYDYEDGGRC